MRKEKLLPLIFDIHHCALDDGPGIRTTVFMKGCPLSCRWCHNPESIKKRTEIAFYPQLCVGCGSCQSICPEDAIDFDNPGRIMRSRCNVCGKCVEECPATALKTIGKYYPPAELVELILDDRAFYEVSGGGVTFSGGEPTIYMDYVSEVMQKLFKNNIHIAIQTSGMFDLDAFRDKLLPYLDIIFYDIKLFTASKHRYYTGQSNKRILHNFKRLYEDATVSVVPTIPLIPGITATVDNLTGIIEFLKQANCSIYDLKPYNPGGIKKRMMIGNPVPPGISEIPMTSGEQEKLEKIFRTQLR